MWNRTKLINVINECEMTMFRFSQSHFFPQLDESADVPFQPESGEDTFYVLNAFVSPVILLPGEQELTAIVITSVPACLLVCYRVCCNVHLIVIYMSLTQ